jgi:hypothetical protein
LAPLEPAVEVLELELRPESALAVPRPRYLADALLVSE